MIVTYNSADVLPGLLDSLPDGLEGIEDYEIIVVDNDSSDNSVELALAHPTGPRVIRMGRNAGYAAGINAATATISPSADVLVLNPDIRLFPGAARCMRERLAETSVGVVVPQILGEDGKTYHSLRREPSVVTAWSDAVLGFTLARRIGLGEIVDDGEIYRRGGTVEWATGAILLVGAATRQAVGDWDESFFLYSEEVDYLRRVRRCGYCVAYEAQARAVHIGGESGVNPRLSALLTANRIKYFRRYNGRAASFAFRLGVVVGEALRAGFGPAHRAALRAALSS